MEFNGVCGPCTPPFWSFDCGVPDVCTSQALGADADGFPCGDRIDYLINVMGESELDACNQVAGVEFNEVCGLCAPHL